MEAKEILDLNELWKNTDSDTISNNVEDILSMQVINTMQARAEKLAEITGSSYHAAYAWLNHGRGDVKIPFLKLCEIAKAYEVDIKKLLTGGKPMFEKKFAVMQTIGNNNKVLAFFGDDHDQATAYGAEIASKGDFKGVISCVRAMFDENGNILNHEYRVFEVWTSEEYRKEN